MIFKSLKESKKVQEIIIVLKMFAGLYYLGSGLLIALIGVLFLKQFTQSGNIGDMVLLLIFSFLSAMCIYTWIDIWRGVNNILHQAHLPPPPSIFENI